MPKIAFSDRTVQSLDVAKRTDFLDEAWPGPGSFGVRVTPAGKKSFVFLYSVRGRAQRQTLGVYRAPVDGRPYTLARAREDARRSALILSQGDDPQAGARRVRESLLFDGLASLYIERWAKRRKKSWREDERNIAKNLLPAWSGLRVAEITRGHIVAVLDEVVDRGAPIMANRLRSLIHKTFGFAVGRDLIDANPCDGVAMPAKETARDRVFEPGELVALWSAFDEEDATVSGLFKLRFLTVQRARECLRMRWDQITESGWWNLPAESMKKGRPQRIFLSPQAQSVLDRIPRDGDFVFRHRDDPEKHRGWPRTAALRVSAACGVFPDARDIRRTAATMLASLGHDRRTVKMVLSHADASVTAIYDLYAREGEIEEAMTSLGGLVERIVGQI